MDSNYLLNLFLVIVPVLLCIVAKVSVLSHWKALLAAVGIVGNLSYLVKLRFLKMQLIRYPEAALAQQLPASAVLYCFTLPLAAILAYLYLNKTFPGNKLDQYTLAFSNLLMGTCIAIIFFAYTKSYPVFTFASLLLLLLFVEYKGKIRFMFRFYRTWGLFLVLYLLAALVQGAGSMTYDTVRTLEFNIAQVPFENYFLLGVMLLALVFLFEVFKGKRDVA